MRPRVLYRTHYQVDEPFLMEVLVARCTSPVRSEYTERVTAGLSSEVKKHGKDFNVPAAGYAVDLARGLGIVTENNVWTERGQLVALCTRAGDASFEEECVLDASERLVHFRCFMEGDGAVLLHIARLAATTDEFPKDGNWNAFAQRMFTAIYADYLKACADIADRLAIRREVERLKSKPFKGNTGNHKCYVHLQTLFRLGLLDRRDVGGQRSYRVSDVGRQSFEAVARHVPSIMALEALAEDGTWAEVAAAAFRLGHGASLGEQEILDLAFDAYRRIVATGVPLCALATLMDAVQIQLMCSGAALITRPALMDILTRLQKLHPSDVRFHVDRRGRPAFIKLAPSVINKD